LVKSGDHENPTHPSQLCIHPEDYTYSVKNEETMGVFPPQKYDEDGQQCDLRTQNSWTLSLGQVETPEMIEVTLVNYMAPYIILQKLTPLMKQEKERPDQNGVE
jgi:hypothetical protein